ncbi:MAG TPA: D-aminoacyl-tRNA deacylase, partial [Planctomycetota bacterium]|nr:D-aminoacyl-tRNA deacylase [Planctomycetota bacterium]
MLTVVQRVQRASVTVLAEVVSAIDQGALLLVGVERGDSEADADATAAKIQALRLFPGRTPMDLTLQQVSGGCLVVPQFTLAAELRHGNRPDFMAAEAPARAEALWLRVAAQLQAHGLEVARGRFGAHMQVALVNDGPVT